MRPKFDKSLKPLIQCARGEKDTSNHYANQAETPARLSSEDEKRGRPEGAQEASPQGPSPAKSVSSPLKKPATFGRSKRLSGQGDFARLFVRGRTLRASGLIGKALPNGLGRIRFACTVRRKTVPQAVLRNRFKRWLREAFRLHQAELPQGFDLALVVSEPPREKTFRFVEKIFLDLCEQLKS